MKKAFFFFIILTSILLCNAQNNVTPLRDKVFDSWSISNTALGILNSSGDKYYLYNEDFYKYPTRNMNQDVVLCVDKNRNSVSEITLAHNEDYHFSKWYEDQTNLYALFSYFSWKEKTFKLVLNPIGKDLSNATWKPEEVVSVKTERSDDFFSFSAVSPDNTKMAVGVVLTNKKGSIKGSSIMVFGENGEMLWNNALDVEFSNPNFKLMEMIVSNTGEVYLALASYGDQSKHSRDNETFHLYKITENNIISADESISFGFLSNAEMMFNKKGNVVIGGYYCTDLDDYETGTYMAIFDTKNDQLNNMNNQEFPREYALDKKGAVGVPKSTNFVVNTRDMFEFQDGTIALLGEQYQKTESSYVTSSGFVNTIYTYYYKNIIASFADEDGKLGDWKMIKKLQIEGPGGSLKFKERQFYGASYTSFLQNDQIYLLYQSHIDNFKGKSDVPCKSKEASKHCTVLTTISSNKDVSTSKVIDPATKTRMVAPLFMDDDGAIILLLAGKKNGQIANLKL